MVACQKDPTRFAKYALYSKSCNAFNNMHGFFFQSRDSKMTYIWKQVQVINHSLHSCHDILYTAGKDNTPLKIYVLIWENMIY